MTEQAKVMRVIDGDTIEVRLLDAALNPTPVRKIVRLLGIDVFDIEATKKCRDQAKKHNVEVEEIKRRGQQARSWLVLRLTGETVVLTASVEPDAPDTDNYGRVLRAVTHNGEDLAFLLTQRNWNA